MFFSGFQARMCDPVEKSTPIFHISYPENPSKSIINDFRDKLSKSIEVKKMPFAVTVGDHPIYKLYLELKSQTSPIHRTFPCTDVVHLLYLQTISRFWY